MFYNCKKLTKISVNFSAWDPAAATSNWVYKVASTGEFYCPAELPQTTGVNNIPAGWTIKTIGDIEDPGDESGEKTAIYAKYSEIIEYTGDWPLSNTDVVFVLADPAAQGENRVYVDRRYVDAYNSNSED